jgi:hypothetical protein
MKVTDEMVSRFLSWPLPGGVCSDRCATIPGYTHRIGTNLLNAAEARAMLEHVLDGFATTIEGVAAEEERQAREGGQ